MTMNQVTALCDASEFRTATRIQGSLLSGIEKKALVWMARRMPSWVNSDHLTILGFASQCCAGICYAGTRWNKQALLWGVVFLALNWFGDSLDGTLARVRNAQRPRYGFYVDHVADSVAALFLLGGLALSGFIYPAIAIGLLVAFLMLSIESYLATYTIGEFHLSHCKFSPTELRLLLAAGNVAVFHDPAVAVFKTHWRLFRFRRGNWDYRNDAYVPRLFDNSHSPALPRGTHCMSEPRANWHVEAVGI